MSHLPPVGLKPALKSPGMPFSKPSVEKQVSFEQPERRDGLPADFAYWPWKKRMIFQWQAEQAAKNAKAKQETETPLETRRGAKRARELEEGGDSRTVTSEQDAVVVAKKLRRAEPPELVEDNSQASSSSVKSAIHTPLMPSMKSGRPELLMAIRHKQWDKAKPLLTLESTGNELVNAVDEQGRTPLMWVALHGQFEFGNTLLKKGAIVNCADDAGVTPLMFAIGGGSPRLFDALLKQGADVHARDLKRKTTLMWAAANDRSYLMSQLLKAKVDPTLTDYKGYTVVDYAVNAGSVTSVNKILEQLYPGNPLNKTVENMTKLNEKNKKQPAPPSSHRP